LACSHTPLPQLLGRPLLLLLLRRLLLLAARWDGSSAG
jgi:hypothetical protein